jgi:acetyl-CoA C-acetyltransferase
LIDAEPLIEAPPARRATAAHTGAATVEAYTVPYGRDGSPESVVVSALTADGGRALARSTDQTTIAAILAADPLGSPVTISGGSDASLELT